MCLALGGIASTALSFIDDTQKAAQQNTLYYNNAVAANQAAIEKYGSELSRQREESANASRERQQAYIEGKQAQGTALASSQNEGKSTDLTLTDLARQAANKISLVDANQKIQAQQGKANLSAIESEAQSRINSVQTSSGPSLLSLAVSGLGAYRAYKNDIANKAHQTSDGMGGTLSGATGSSRGMIDTRTAGLQRDFSGNTYLGYNQYQPWTKTRLTTASFGQLNRSVYR